MGLQLGSSMTSGTTASNLLANNPLGTTGVQGALSSAQSFGSSYPVSTPLPSWLSTNTSSEVGELEDTYKNAPASILAAADTAADKGNAAADMAYGQQLRQGANATAQLTNTARQQGGTGSTSSIVAGQMAEDAAKNRTDARLQIAQMKLNATTQAASLSSQIASSLGQLRTSYLNTLANVSTTTRGQDMQQADAALQYGSTAASTAAAAAKAAPTTPTGPTEYYTGMRGAGLGSYGGPMGSDPTAGQHLNGWGFGGG